MSSTSRALLVGVLSVCAAVRGAAQGTPAAPATVSGLVYAQFRHTSPAGGTAREHADLTRGYLTITIPARHGVSGRFTTDLVSLAGPGTWPRGWTLRLKYAYADWQAWQAMGSRPASLTLRAGMVPTPEIEMMEQFWPRGLAKTPMDQLGFVPSADLGLAVQVRLPHGQGELYGGVFNGPGYAAPVRARFRDLNVRASWTPLARKPDAGWIRGLQVSPYVLRGSAARTLTPGGPGLRSDLWGVHLAVAQPTVTAGAEYANRRRTYDSATDATRHTITGTLQSAFAVIRPPVSRDHRSDTPWSLILRGTRFRPDQRLPGYQYLWLAGTGYDFSASLTLFANFQRTRGRAGAVDGPRTTSLQAVWRF